MASQSLSGTPAAHTSDVRPQGARRAAAVAAAAARIAASEREAAVHLEVAPRMTSCQTHAQSLCAGSAVLVSTLRQERRSNLSQRHAASG
jgi:hypothetical protein